MAIYDHLDATERFLVRRALEAMAERGVPLRTSPLIEARTRFLEHVRDLNTTHLVLMKRGRVHGALLSKQGWLAMHDTVESLLDEIAVLRWPLTNEKAIPLEHLSPEVNLGLSIIATEPPDDAFELAHVSYHVQLAPAVVARMETSPIMHRSLVGLLRPLARWPFPLQAGSPVGSGTPRAWRRRALGFRVAWRVDGEVVTVVRLAPG